MNSQQINLIISAFNLGNPEAKIAKISGGLTHRMWRLHTNRGLYAIKELDATIMQRPQIETIYINSEKIAAILKQQSIPAEPALLYNNTPLYYAGNAVVMVYPWVDGQKLALPAVTTASAAKIGKLIAAIHQANIQIPNLPLPSINMITLQRWQELIDRAEEEKISWVHTARHHLQDLITWGDLYAKAKVQLNRQLVISHRDADSKNVLWLNIDSPVLIDWESAGLINPIEEIITVAMEWAGLAEIIFREDIFVSVVNSYQEVLGKFDASRVSFSLFALIGNYLNWLEFNMDRSANASEYSKEMQTIGIAETITTFKKLNFISQKIDALIELIK